MNVTVLHATMTESVLISLKDTSVNAFLDTLDSNVSLRSLNVKLKTRVLREQCVKTCLEEEPPNVSVDPDMRGLLAMSLSILVCQVILPFV
jgi:hypothetical protein